MDPPLSGSTAMSHNEFQSSEPIEPQEASSMKHEMHVLGIDIAKRVFHAVGMDDRVIAPSQIYFHPCRTAYAMLLPTGAHRKGAYSMADPINASIVVHF